MGVATEVTVTTTGVIRVMTKATVTKTTEARVTVVTAVSTEDMGASTTRGETSEAGPEEVRGEAAGVSGNPREEAPTIFTSRTKFVLEFNSFSIDVLFSTIFPVIRINVAFSFLNFPL